MLLAILSHFFFTRTPCFWMPLRFTRGSGWHPYQGSRTTVKEPWPAWDIYHFTAFSNTFFLRSQLFPFVPSLPCAFHFAWRLWDTLAALFFLLVYLHVLNTRWMLREFPQLLQTAGSILGQNQVVAQVLTNAFWHQTALPDGPSSSVILPFCRLESCLVTSSRAPTAQQVIHS